MMHQSDSHSDHAGAGPGRTLLMTLALGLLIAAGWRCVGATHARRSGSQPKKLPRPLQTWEGEGGRPIDADHHQPALHPEPLPHVAGNPNLQR